MLESATDHREGEREASPERSRGATDPSEQLDTGPGLARMAWPPLVTVLILLAAWEVFVRWQDISPAVLPTPTDVLDAMWDDRANLWGATWITLQTVLLGFGSALVLAILIGVVVDSFGWVRRSIYPVIVVSQTLPIVAIAPLVVIWFGFGISSHAFVVAMYTFFPVAVSLAQGLASTDEDAMNLLRTMGSGRVRLLLKVRFPSALTQLFTGIRVSMSFAVIAAVIAQFVGAVEGLGIYMLTMKNALRTDLVFGPVTVTSAVTLLLFGGVVVLQRLVMPWYRPRTQGDAG
ncbi:MAG: ABC transporter permease [bacterium]|nr:ABC transporter permease [bacterium]MDE0439728.1 ABC transporter permease [bacterium]